MGTKAFYFPHEHLILLQANTDIQPAWNFHRGRGRFSVSDREVRNAFQEAAEVICSSVLDWFDLRVVHEELRPEILIRFLISGYEVGTWHEHEFTLFGE